ncbi:D-alanine aminotransferase [Lignipirellula cremea]|uniref:branched-chain-amino-acid transaminase n=2 Tax=Lignipirellula cremea TaxID=2528010 RepID=A0A518E115_9BACT|nr:D-alanine aminotransferase [Lignipirellula cremea]
MIAYLNGRWVAPHEINVPVNDTGFLLGVTVAERLRTFGGELFSLDEHFERLARSLAIVGVEPPEGLANLQQATIELTARNHALLSPGDDLGVTVFVTPGPYDHKPESKPRTCIHSSPLPFADWAGLYAAGQPLRTVATQQIPAACWPPELKCRSRMHYYLADHEAAAMERGARAVLLDQNALATEASTANLVAYRTEEGLISPPTEKILPGISVKTLFDLAAELDIRVVHRDLTVADLETSDELYLTSTSPCLLPVPRINGRQLGDGQPGPVYQRLISAWSAKVGLNIVEQAQQYQRRGE